MIPWEISDVTTTAVSQSAGSVMAITTVVTAQMRGTAVSILLSNLQLSPPSHMSTRVHHRIWVIYFLFSLALYFSYDFCATCTFFFTDIMFLNADLTLPFYSYLLTLHTEKNPVCEQ